MHDHYRQVINAPKTACVIAVACRGCRAVSFWQQPEPAVHACLYHVQVCSAPDPLIIEILSPVDATLD